MISIGLLGQVRTPSDLCGGLTYFEVGDQESLAQVGPYCLCHDLDDETAKRVVDWIGSSGWAGRLAG
jgi:hypothetical protein